jgi:diguanylate cyclase (GGDEF)-like protein/putative nucleotidyltransferase with HDIG domain
LSYHDQLTGLYNRRFYEEELKRLDTERNLPLTIAMGDINGLKLINDSFGHQVGDEQLKKVAEVLKGCCRADDIIARIGGDEFVIILPKTDTPEAEKLIVRINNFTSKNKVENLDISISFGYETKTKKAQKIEDVFKGAEDHMYRHKLYESASIKNKMIEIIMNTLFEKNPREMLHSKRVSEICEFIAKCLNFGNDDILETKLAGLMHDIGKIGIEEKVLSSTGKLNEEEWKEIKRHSEVGYRILSSSNEFSEIADHVLAHHERWDGAGYPKRLKGEEISIQARIIAIADSFDVMIGERTYKQALSVEEALEEIRRCAGTQFDPEIAKVFVTQYKGSDANIS